MAHLTKLVFKPLTHIQKKKIKVNYKEEKEYV